MFQKGSDCMANLERLDELVKFIEARMQPYCLNESGRVSISNLLRKYSYELLEECVDISYENYIERDEQGELLKDSVEEFLSKIGGIAHNKSLSPIEKEMNHIINIGKKNCSYWNVQMSKSLLDEYVALLRYLKWDDDAILADLQEDIIRETKRVRSWTQWRNMMESLVGEDSDEK